MKKFHIFFSGPIERETIIELNNFIELLTKFCHVPRVQAHKFRNINWREGITLELPTNFLVKYGEGSKHLSPTNLYYRDVLIAENVGRVQTQIHLDNLRMVTTHHLRRQPIIEQTSQEIKERMTTLLQQKALDKARKKAIKHSHVEAGNMSSSYMSATIALGVSPRAISAVDQDVDSTIDFCGNSTVDSICFVDSMLESSCANVNPGSASDNHTPGDEYKVVDANEYASRDAEYDIEDYDDCDQPLVRRI